MTIKLKSFSALTAKLLQPLNFLTLSNDQNPAKPCHRPFEQSLFLFNFRPIFMLWTENVLPGWGTGGGARLSYMEEGQTKAAPPPVHEQR